MDPCAIVEALDVETMLCNKGECVIHDYSFYHKLVLDCACCDSWMQRIVIGSESDHRIQFVSSIVLCSKY